LRGGALDNDLIDVVLSPGKPVTGGRLCEVATNLFGTDKAPAAIELVRRVGRKQSHETGDVAAVEAPAVPGE